MKGIPLNGQALPGQCTTDTTGLRAHQGPGQSGRKAVTSAGTSNDLLPYYLDWGTGRRNDPPVIEYIGTLSLTIFPFSLPLYTLQHFAYYGQGYN